MRSISGAILTTILMTAAFAVGQSPAPDPHGDPDRGVLRDAGLPRGDCRQCHPLHAESWEPPEPRLLFTENDNSLAFFEDGDGPCHSARADNYPLTELDRLPDTEPEAGYFEANLGGSRRAGVEFRGRWPGQPVYTDPRVFPSGRYHSPHAQDPDMPLRDAAGEGLCLNCHDPHGTPNPHDLLTAPYRAIGGASGVGPPVEYTLCFSCHGVDGPSGMDPENRFIEDYYDPGLNGENAGHRIRMDPAVALSWPAHVRRGDMLPCYDCHNPHGSRGHNGVEPNAFVISDQRPEWSGLTDTLNDPLQCRAFCLGCHIPSDGVPGSRSVEGIVMNTIPGTAGHATMDSHSCYDCHGRDYASATGKNVHNPGTPGEGPSPWEP